MQYGAPEVVVQPSDPWTIPATDLWNTASATRLHSHRNYEARDFQPSEQNTFEPSRLLPWPDLRMHGVHAAGARRPSVYAGGGFTRDQQGPGQSFANDSPHS